ncbi:hypothetical protein BC826DRAFT_202660 [Russula brevipes]|nr:hypothetical protein BC826DRAFT_202660 [Russula brevipes]
MPAYVIDALKKTNPYTNLLSAQDKILYRYTCNAIENRHLEISEAGAQPSSQGLGLRERIHMIALALAVAEQCPSHEHNDDGGVGVDPGEEGDEDIGTRGLSFLRKATTIRPVFADIRRLDAVDPLAFFTSFGSDMRSRSHVHKLDDKGGIRLMWDRTRLNLPPMKSN